jgi:predicted DNA-binding transcriptional regulator YafY
MPLNHDAFSRYRLLDERLRRKPSPTLEDLINHVSEALDKTISKRTIQLDLQEMRYSQSLKFEAPIRYNRIERSYSYEREDYSISNLPVTADELHGLEFAISILDQFKQLPAIKEFEEAIMKIAATVKINKENRGENDFIQFDRPASYVGIEYVEPIVRAIREKRVLQFSYQTFGSEQVKQHLIEPYFVREFKSRFYMIGNSVSKTEHKVLTFSLDRIIHIKITDTFFSEKKIDNKKFYENIYGITVNDSKAENVVLSFVPVQGKYILSQPIHPTQLVLKNAKEELRIELNIQINHEFIMQLLSYGANVKVIKPKTLIERIKKELENTLQQY